MVSNKAGAHDDDEPLLPLISDSGYSKQHQHTTVSSVKLKEISTSSTSHHHHHKEDDEILTSSSLSGSTAHESLPEVHDHHHDHSQGHSHSHGHGHGHSHGHSHSHSHTHGAHDHHHPVTGARTSTPNSIVSIESAEDDAPTLAEIQESEKDKRRLKIAIALCSTFFCVELAGGLLADSLALLSDSFHLLTDITSFIISLAAIYLSHRPSTATHTFGYHRAEVLGALFSIFLIWGLTLLLVMEAYDRVRHPIDIDGKTMSIIAVLGVCVNVVLMFVLGGHHHHHGHSHGHGHDHGHGQSHDHGSSGHTDHTPLRSEEDHDHDDHDHDGSISHKPIAQHDHDHDHDHDHEHGHEHGSGGHHHHTNLNITAATLHVLGDLLSSVGVLISSLIITFYPSLTYLDPVCTFIFSILVIATTVGVFKQSMGVLMERVPYGMNTEDVRETICDVPGVLEVKSLHVWSLTIGKVALTSTVFLQPEVQDLRKAHQILAVVRRSLKKKYGIRQSTIQMEMYAPDHHRVPEIGSHQHLNGAGGPSQSSDPFSDTLARHDQDIIFSIGDEDDDHHDNHNHSHGHGHSRSHDHGSHHHSHGHQRGPGTPLSSYRENRADGEDESESEMEQEILVEPNRWA